MAEEVTDLEGLLQLLEEDLDAPSRLIELADARCRVLGVVGNEGRDDFLAVNLDEHFHAPEGFGILAADFPSKFASNWPPDTDLLQINATDSRE